MDLLKTIRELLARKQGEVYNVLARCKSAAEIIMNSDNPFALKFNNVYRFECYDANGNFKWVDEVHNLVTTAGITDFLTRYFKNGTTLAAWYVGLVDGAVAPTYAAGDTYSSHAGWTENVGYSNTNRPTLTLGTPTAGSVDNSASKAVFNINAAGTINGAFTASNNTKGDSTAGASNVLWGEGAFTGGARVVANGDTLNVTVTLSGS